MKIFNWHIIHDRELRQLRERDIQLARKFSKKEIEALLDGSYHIRRNPKRKAA